MAFVFISYSHEASKYARLVVEALAQRGWKAWIDERTDYGTQWPRVIREKIDEVALLSSS